MQLCILGAFYSFGLFTAENPGTFADKTADIVEDESKQFDWRDLARELEAEREALYLRKLNGLLAFQIGQVVDCTKWICDKA